MSDNVRNGQSILGNLGAHQLDRRQMLRTGLQVGAALGVPGLAGLTVIGGPGEPNAQEDPTIDPNAPEWEQWDAGHHLHSRVVAV